MAIQLSVDTSFLIDLQRERSIGKAGAAHQFLEQTPEAELFLSAIALGEFAEGFDRSDDAVILATQGAHTLVEVNHAIALTYSRVSRQLRTRGELIGTNDLWIGCTSLHLGIPILTANVEHFQRIDGLGVVRYR